MKKALILLVFVFFQIQMLFGEEELNLLPDINSFQMDDIYQRYITGVQAPDIQLLITNGSVVPFNETIEIDEGIMANYSVHVLTNFQHESGIIRDITTTRKSQYRSDCTKFATVSAIEIEITRQFFDIFNRSVVFAEENGGEAANVEIDLAEAFEREINGCNENTADTISSSIINGIIHEEHYPYNERKFLEKAYYSKRDTGRYGFSNGFACRADIGFVTNPNYNDTFLNTAISNGFLIFKPTAGYAIREDPQHHIPGAGVIDRIKNYIDDGKPAIISYAMGVTGGGVNPKLKNDGKRLVSTVNPNNPWGKMIPSPGGIAIFDNTAWTDHKGHAAVVVGYMTPENSTDPEYLLIKDSHGGININAFPVTGNDGTLLVDCLRSVDVFDTINVERNGIIMTENDLDNLDTDNDGVPDLFDNSSFSGIYFGSNTFSQNPDQFPADNDDSGLEFDLCPYVSDNKKFNMDHDNRGDLCDYDIDGDGISNIDEGLGEDQLYKFIENHGIPAMSGQYSALNPFLGKNAVGDTVLRNKFFITSCFAGLNTHCDEPDPDFCKNGNKPGEKYITDLCFFDDNLLESAPVNSGKDDKDGTYKFIGGAKHEGPANAGEELTSDFPAPHGFYKKFDRMFISVSDRGTGYYRKYKYTNDSGNVEEGYGLNWNIPGYFEMKDVNLQEYVDAGYGENWPENYYNCHLHCIMLDKIDVSVMYFNSYKCKDACDDIYLPVCDNTIDYDCDGIRDYLDNCPYIRNTDQRDVDSTDPVTGETYGDGVGDVCDSCTNLLNPRELNNKEIVTAPCDENGIGGAACMLHTRNSTRIDKNGNYWWQPDHDLDGIGDNCDNDTVWASFQGTPLNKPVWEKDYEDSNEVITYYDVYPNDSLFVPLKMNSTYSLANYTATTRFCWLTPDEYNENKWGTEGKCTTEAKNNSQGCIIDFGYSHGSDPKPTDYLGNPYWKESTLDNTPEHTVIKGKGSKTTVWNWRKDFADDSASPEIVSVLSNAPLCAEYDSISEECKDSSISRFHYSLSTGTRGDDPDNINYLVDAVNTNGGNENVNPEYFKNQQRYARTERLSKDPVEISYYYYRRGSPNDLGPVYCLGAPCNRPIEGLQKFIIEKFKEIVTGPNIFERPGMEHFFKNDFGSDFLKSGAAITEWSMTGSGTPSVKTASRPQALATVSKNIEGTNTGLSLIPQGSMQLMGYNPESTTGTFYQIVEMDINSNGDWRTTGIINNTPENFSPVASTFHNNSFYVVSIEDNAASADRNIYVIVPIESGGNTCSWSDNIFVPEFIGSLPDLSNITIHSFNDSLIAVGEGANGMEIHKLVEQSGDAWFENITGTSAPSMRDAYNIEINDGILYLAGGVEIINQVADLKTDIWKFNESEGWTLIRNDLNLFPVSFRIDFDGGDIILTDRIFKSDATAERVRFNSDGSGDTPVVEIVTVEGVP
ncbi:MAG TPA: thrombospondin type 3 repeat-containing protein, partial [bacterium]|nr:thrombospondin type 3 repeat-containing protein [bacterium]